MDDKKTNNEKNVFKDEHIIREKSEEILKNKSLSENELWKEYQDLSNRGKYIL